MPRMRVIAFRRRLRCENPVDRGAHIALRDIGRRNRHQSDPAEGRGCRANHSPECRARAGWATTQEQVPRALLQGPGEGDGAAIALAQTMAA